LAEHLFLPEAVPFDEARVRRSKGSALGSILFNPISLNPNLMSPRCSRSVKDGSKRTGSILDIEHFEKIP
jgi:hypothetical protein